MMVTDVRDGQVWRSETGNRFRVVAARLSGHDGKVCVRRLDAPKWDDGAYTFHASQFDAMTLESDPAEEVTAAAPDDRYQVFGMTAEGKLTRAGVRNWSAPPTREDVLADQAAWEEWAEAQAALHPGAPLRESVGKTAAVYVHPVSRPELVTRHDVVRETAGAA